MPPLRRRTFTIGSRQITDRRCTAILTNPTSPGERNPVQSAGLRLFSLPASRPLGGVLRKRFAVPTIFFYFVLRQIFNTNEAVLRSFVAANEFVEFCLDRRAIAILCVLNDKHHKKGNDCGPRIDHKLPG